MYPPAPSLTLAAAVVAQVGVHGRENPQIIDLICRVFAPVTAQFRPARPAVLLLLAVAWPRPENWCLRTFPDRQGDQIAAKPVSLDASMAPNYSIFLALASRDSPISIPSACRLTFARVATAKGDGTARAERGGVRWLRHARALCAKWTCLFRLSSPHSRPSCALLSRVDGAWLEPRATELTPWSAHVAGPFLPP